MTSTPTPLPLPPLPARPLVSVLVASYNYARYIGEALDSLLAQGYPYWEAIVCDDGSTDDSCEIIAGYAARDARIRLVRQANAGVGAALNAAFVASRGDVVCLLDADDYFTPEKIQTVVAKMRAVPGAGFVQHTMSVVDATGRRIRRLSRPGVFEEGWLRDRVVRRGGRWRSMPASALALRREVADRLFPMPAALLRSMADAYLYMLAPLMTGAGFIDRELAAYRLHGANLTGTTRLDPPAIARFLDGWQRIFASIEQKRTEAGLDVPSLDASRHLTVREHRYLNALFGGERTGRLLRQGSSVAKAILQDDLYGLPRKLIGILALGAAPLLPRSMRVGWVNGVLGVRWSLVPGL